MELALDFYATHAFWVWAAVAAGLLAVEVATGSGWMLWPSASAGAVAALALFEDLPWPFALLIFAALTIAASLAARRFIIRDAPDGADINDNAARLIGHHGQAVAAFSHGAGRVFIDGKEWAAQLDSGETAVKAGARVVVTGIDGATLTVRAESAA